MSVDPITREDAALSTWEDAAIVVLYNRLRDNPALSMTPRTFFFAGKAAPASRLAKLIIKFLNNLAGTIDDDRSPTGRASWPRTRPCAR